MTTKINYLPVEEAVKIIESGERVHFSGTATFPVNIANALYKRGMENQIEGITIQYMHNISPTPFAGEECLGKFHLEVIYTGGNIRKAVNQCIAGYIPTNLGEVARLIRSGVLKVNTAIVQTSLPDRHGYVSLGLSAETNIAALDSADKIIAVVNPNMPRTFGDTIIHTSKIDIFCYDETPLPVIPDCECSETDIKIAAHCAELIEDGATMQLGIGNLPNAVLANLTNHKNIGIHTEMFSDGILPLCESGVINNAEKGIDKGKLVASFIMGNKKLYDFIDDNPLLIMRDVAYTNNPEIIAQNPKVIALNAAIEVDLTGQINAESIGTSQFSGCGGQLDFVRGANASKGGKSIIAMPATTNKGVSKIVPTLSPGATVTTPRQDIHYVITEFGIADLYGKTLQKRAKELIKIANPMHQEELEKAAFDRFGKHFIHCK